MHQQAVIDFRVDHFLKKLHVREEISLVTPEPIRNSGLNVRDAISHAAPHPTGHRVDDVPATVPRGNAIYPERSHSCTPRACRSLSLE
eukprot:CAMPEP_0175973434 /NCGR_PEP_ID=MMETSP0108-20121206/42796_1 /TAXON_ID=195067 ORGANISM="Goniomonas pacifica, Strain CCMP1869" /NCGR_SAMPLE_ID=MMETSP0108 /ASSEMBLY_ACC=CAM_ASM_000204 /LENGTH=87 /DNA_ID=CAMNT_0017302889 /DNA_START=185 /DNA_END=446 /DNA_ORIENTATION=+